MVLWTERRLLSSLQLLERFFQAPRGVKCTPTLIQTEMEKFNLKNFYLGGKITKKMVQK